MEIIIGLLSGALGGNIVGALLKKNSMGTQQNAVIGILGGGLGTALLGLRELPIGCIPEVSASGGVLIAIIAVVKGMTPT